MTPEQFAREVCDELSRTAKRLTEAGAYAEAAGVRLAVALMYKRLEAIAPPSIDSPQD